MTCADPSLLRESLDAWGHIRSKKRHIFRKDIQGGKSVEQTNKKALKTTLGRPVQTWEGEQRGAEATLSILPHDQVPG